LWVDEYVTGSGSDRVGLARNNNSFNGSPATLASNDGELNATQTRSLPLPVLYLSAYEQIELGNAEDF